MKLLIIYLYRSLWFSIAFWFLCITLGGLGGYFLASYFNQQEEKDQLHTKQEIQESKQEIQESLNPSKK